jgi:hypothetical protein
MAGAADSTGKLVALIVARSQPRTNKPKPGGPIVEDVLRDLDRRNAQCYADIELKSHRIRRLAEAVDSRHGEASIVSDVIDEDDSLVYHLGNLSRVMTEKSTDDD